MPSPTAQTVIAKDAAETQNPLRLRELASWYRELAERAGNPAIWEGRLRMAGDLDAEADRIERAPAERGALRTTG